jgi:hypothetical protein
MVEEVKGLASVEEKMTGLKVAHVVKEDSAVTIERDEDVSLIRSNFQI